MAKKSGQSIKELESQFDNRLKEMSSQYEKKIYDLKQLLDISCSLCSTLEYETLIESILYTSMTQMRVLGAGIFIFDDIDSNEFHLSTNYNGIDVQEGVEYSIPFNDPIITFLNKTNTTFTVEDLRDGVAEKTNIDVIASLKPTLIIPLFQKRHMNGILLLGERIDLGDGVEYDDYDKQQIVNLAALAAVAINNASLMERSSMDMMTHLKLKTFFFSILTERLDLSITQNIPLSVLMFDIDFFKKFNDTWGHACGDYVLQTVAKIIKNNVRSQDVASRYGGEEFTVMLPCTNTETALIVAERIRVAVEKMDFEYEGQHMTVTISGGVSTFNVETNPVTSAKELVDQADKALYVSKGNGRNRISCADEGIIGRSK